MEQNEVKCPFLGTMVLKAKKTSVLVLIPRLFDRSRSRTVDALLPSNSTPGESSAALRLAARGLPGLRADGGNAAPHLPPLRQDLGGPCRRTRPPRLELQGTMYK